MGRVSTGAITTKESARIELSYLLREGYIKKEGHILGSLSWTDGSSITIESKYTEDEKYLRLVYTLIDSTGEKYSLDYKVGLYTKPSNLGVGEVLFFVCPQARNLCRVLYRAYGSPIWKSRGSYARYVYYPQQISSKRSKYNDRYWDLKRKLEELYKKRASYTFKGKSTKRAERIDRLERALHRMNSLRWSSMAMPKSLNLALKGEL